MIDDLTKLKDAVNILHNLESLDFDSFEVSLKNKEDKYTFTIENHSQVRLATKGLKKQIYGYISELGKKIKAATPT